VYTPQGEYEEVESHWPAAIKNNSDMYNAQIKMNSLNIYP
jgi:hypothetical protein